MHARIHNVYKKVREKFAARTTPRKQHCASTAYKAYEVTSRVLTHRAHNNK